MTIRLRVLTTVVAALVLTTVVAPPAVAHNGLRSTDPADGARVERLPTTVVLTFDEPAIALGTQIVITGPTGPVQQGTPRLVDNTVAQDVAAGSPAGRYEVSWRVTSADGHPVTGTFAFTAGAGSSPGPSAAPPAPAPTTTGPAPAPRQEPAYGIPTWAWVVTLLAAVVALGSIGYHLRQRRLQG